MYGPTMIRSISVSFRVDCQLAFKVVYHLRINMNTLYGVYILESQNW